MHLLWRSLLWCHRFGLSLDSFVVFQPVLTRVTTKDEPIMRRIYSPENRVSFSLSWIFNVRFVEKILDSEQDLLDSNGRSPIFLLVEERQTDCSRWIHVGMEQRWLELTFRWCGWIIFLEEHPQFVQSTFPRSLSVQVILEEKRKVSTHVLTTRNGTFPVQQIKCSVWILRWFSHETLSGVNKDYSTWNVDVILTKGWSFLQAFRSSANRAIAIPDILDTSIKEWKWIQTMDKMEWRKVEIGNNWNGEKRWW